MTNRLFPTPYITYYHLPMQMAQLSCCANGFYATESPAKMEHFIRRYFPRRTTTTNSAVADQSPIRMCPDERTSAEDIEKHIRSCRKVHIAFEDAGAAKEEHRSYGFEVLASTALKTLFVEYAAKRGVSLRLLRFSHAGRALFLSQVGKKTPEEMGLRDWDVIAVACQAPEDEETKGSVGRKNDKPVSNRVKPKRHRKSSKKKRARGPGKEKLTKREETLEELKILVSRWRGGVTYPLLQPTTSKGYDAHDLLFSPLSIPRRLRGSTRSCSRGSSKRGSA